RIYSVRENNGVRVPHRNAGDTVSAARIIMLITDGFFTWQKRGDQRGFENRRAHIDRYGIHFAAGDMQKKRFYSRKRFYFKLFNRHHAVIVKIFADAPYRVAAHLTFAAVGV